MSFSIIMCILWSVCTCYRGIVHKSTKQLKSQTHTTKGKKIKKGVNVPPIEQNTLLFGCLLILDSLPFFSISSVSSSSACYMKGQLIVTEYYVRCNARMDANSKWILDVMCIAMHLGRDFSNLLFPAQAHKRVQNFETTLASAFKLATRSVQRSIQRSWQQSRFF